MHGGHSLDFLANKTDTPSRLCFILKFCKKYYSKRRFDRWSFQNGTFRKKSHFLVRDLVYQFFNGRCYFAVYTTAPSSFKYVWITVTSIVHGYLLIENHISLYMQGISPAQGLGSYGPRIYLELPKLLSLPEFGVLTSKWLTLVFVIQHAQVCDWAGLDLPQGTAL